MTRSHMLEMAKPKPSLKAARFNLVTDVVERLRPGYPVFCLHQRRLWDNARYFLQHFPGRVLYAVKCNPALEVIRILAEAGIKHFDTASLNEIALIRENVPRGDCYYMHPVKSRASLITAKTVYAIDHYIIDHESELTKLVEVIGGGDGRVCFIRIATPKADSFINLSDKFGAEMAEAARLQRLADKEGYQTGLAFHVGTQCRQPEAYEHAMDLVAKVINLSGISPHYVDVGGGFPSLYGGEQLPPLLDYFKGVEKKRKKMGLRQDAVLMCEPGRAMVADTMSVIVQVHLRKDRSLYINDGIYHNLADANSMKVSYPMRLIRDIGQGTNLNRPKVNRIGDPDQTLAYRIYGPTCDSLDMLNSEVLLPADVCEGDWIQIGLMGAYSNALSTHFNGFQTDAIYTVEEDPLVPAYAA